MRSGEPQYRRQGSAGQLKEVDGASNEVEGYGEKGLDVSIVA